MKARAFAHEKYHWLKDKTDKFLSGPFTPMVKFWLYNMMGEIGNLNPKSLYNIMSLINNLIPHSIYNIMGVIDNINIHSLLRL